VTTLVLDFRVTFKTLKIWCQRQWLYSVRIKNIKVNERDRNHKDPELHMNISLHQQKTVEYLYRRISNNICPVTPSWRGEEVGR
jgi:hypothetical protein